MIDALKRKNPDFANFERVENANRLLDPIAERLDADKPERPQNPHLLAMRVIEASNDLTIWSKNQGFPLPAEPIISILENHLSISFETGGTEESWKASWAMRGSIVRRGKKSWRLKFDVERNADGRRRTRYATVKGTRQDAQKELTRLLAQADAGTLVEPSNVTVREYIQAWLGASPEPAQAPPSPPHGLTSKTAERYRQLAEQQIYPHLGAIVLQKLRPAKIQEWHETLLKTGNRKGRAKGGPLSGRTVGHAHRVLHRALERAVENETLTRNVASVIAPPKEQEVEILSAQEIATVLTMLDGHALYPLVAVDLATGLRRGELLALPWSNLDLEAATLRVDRSLEETRAGLR